MHHMHQSARSERRDVSGRAVPPSGQIEEHRAGELNSAPEWLAFGQSRPATCFPTGSSLACSWDPELVRRMGNALAEECHEMGVSVLLGPGINIRRTPLAGRS